jgi:hypothetical protein
MFDALHHFIYDFRGIVLPVALITGAFFSYRMWAVLKQDAAPDARPQSRRTPRSLAAGGKPEQQQFLPEKPTPPASVTAGEESRKHKAQIGTIKIRADDHKRTTIGSASTELLPVPSEPSVGDEVGKLFAGLDDTLQPAPDAAAEA